MTYVLRPYQQQAVDATWSALRLPGNPVVVAPCGSGKSLLLAELCRHAWQKWAAPSIILAHRKELLVQNAEKIQALMDDVPVGIYSAGLKSRETESPVICAGIQSVYKKAFQFGERKLVIVDEAHLLGPSDETMYQKFLADLLEANPKMRVVGMTATPYRTGEGSICKHDGMFQRIAHEISIHQLIEGGYLSKLTNSPPEVTFDCTGLPKRYGEYVQRHMESVFTADAIKTEAACLEIVKKSHDRKTVLVFAASVEHAEDVSRRIENISGQKCGCITGDTLPLERAKMFHDFRSGTLRWLSNCLVCTTGLDVPGIDCIAVLRATASPGLWAQIIGRGMRISPGKDSCRILDHGGNAERHGPIDSPSYGEYLAIPGNNGKGEAVSKECPSCHEMVHAGLRTCECTYEFPPPELKHDQYSDDYSEILTDSPPKVYRVADRTWGRHTKRNKTEGKPDTVRVDYTCTPEDGSGGNLEEVDFSEWLCPEHTGYAREKFLTWWIKFSRASTPYTVDDCLNLMDAGCLADVNRLLVGKEGRWDRIISHEVGERPADWNEVGQLDAWDEAIPF